MTAINDSAQPDSGEARLKSRRHRFLRFCAMGMVVAAMVGFFSGIAADSVAEGGMPPFVLAAFVLAAIAGFVWFSWDYLGRVDELDLADNLWASLIGLYFYVVALPSWQIFADAGVLPEPQQWPIYIATLVFSMLAYGARKLGWR